VLYDIPDSVAFDRADLPVAMSLTFDLGQYRWIPTVQGQQCSEVRSKKLEQPVAARAWSWATDPASGVADKYQIDLNVTGWSSEKSARAQVALVRRNAGACRFAERVSTVVADSGDWTALGHEVDGIPRVYAVSAVPGGLVVAVTVTSRVTTDVTLKTANTLVRAAARELERSGLTQELVALQAKGLRVTAPGAAQPTSPAADRGAVTPPATANG
jgi:hypothetical protein